MSVDPEFIEHLRDLFSGMGPLRTGRMFSGAALYAEEDAMFAMVSASGTVYMKSDAETEAAYLASGSTPFWYTRGARRQEVRSLMSLPESALDDPEEAMHWARLSLPPKKDAPGKGAGHVPEISVRSISCGRYHSLDLPLPQVRIPPGHHRANTVAGPE